MANIKVNGVDTTLEAKDGTPLLWYIRETLGMTGTKFGCGQGLCGACTVHVDGQAVRSCQTFVEDLDDGAEITTIEGLDARGEHPLQLAWIKNQVPQCGYCQSGQIMQAAELFEAGEKPSRDDIIAHMNGNLCRCMTYDKIVDAVEDALNA